MYVFWFCVNLSITSRYCTKMAKLWFSQTMPHNSEASLVFLYQNLGEIWIGSHPMEMPNRDRYGRLKSVIFDQ